MTDLAFAHAATMFEPAPVQWATPYELAKALDPDTVQTPALDLIDAALTDVEAGRCDRLILNLPPQEGKSTRVTTVGPLWFLNRNRDRRIAVVSYNSELADEFGRTIRNHIVNNDGDEGALDLGMRLSADNGSIRRFSIAGHRGGVRSVGISGGLTGRPVDALFIDDPISNMEQALSPVWRERAWRFWTSVGRPRLAPHAPVILVLTRWHHDDLAGRLLAAEDGHTWRVINIPAQASHRPEKGETDPLGREPGEWMQSARMYRDAAGLPRQRTPEEWEAIRVTVGPAVWGALYQGNPSPVSGDIFPAEWATYAEPMHIERTDGSNWVPGEVTMCQSWDLAFKDTTASDYVVGQVWARIGMQLFLLDQVRGRMSFTATLQAIKDLSAKWPQAIAKFVEDKANGPAVINALSNTTPGLIPVEPDGSKLARAHAVSPLAHSQSIVLPEAKIAPWVADLRLELAQFPTGAYDDQVDTLTQAVNKMLLMPMMSEQIITSEDLEDEDIDAYGYLGASY